MKKNSNKHNNDIPKNFDPKDFKKEAELTNKVIQNFLINKLNDKIDKKKDIDALVHTMQEFLNCFIVLGYNFEGEPVNFISAKCQQEADSLATLVNKFFVSNMQQRDNS